MKRQHRPFEDLSSYKKDNMVVSVAAQEDACKEKKAVLKFRQSVSKEEAPIYGNLQINEKDNNSTRFFSANANGLLLQLNHNFKAEQLKSIFVKYQVRMGLQETCINWREFRLSKTLVSLLRNGALPIQFVYSHNVLKDENIGPKQLTEYVRIASSCKARWSRSYLVLAIVSVVKLACCKATALRAIRIVLSTACP